MALVVMCAAFLVWRQNVRLRARARSPIGSDTETCSAPHVDIEDLATPLGRRVRSHKVDASWEGEGSPLYTMGQVVDVRQAHLELTTKCNARCPQCARNVQGGVVKPALPMAELRLPDVCRIMSRTVMRRMKRVYMCGNYGDPLSARDIVEIVSYLREANPDCVVGLHTNGGVRNAESWQKLGALLPKPSYCRFGIDGLADTNHL